MHRRKIDIVIASQSGDLAAILTPMPMPEGFTLSLSAIGSLDPKECPVCDLLIHDLGDPAPGMIEKLSARPRWSSAWTQRLRRCFQNPPANHWRTSGPNPSPLN